MCSCLVVFTFKMLNHGITGGAVRAVKLIPGITGGAVGAVKLIPGISGGAVRGVMFWGRRE
jgi:hypothetical protein